MIEDKAKIFLAFSGNMISSGNREIIKFLVKNKMVDIIVTTSAGIEEDIIKCLKPFHTGSFEAPGRVLFDQGIGRIGNIFVPHDRYTYFEKWMRPVFEKLYKFQKDNGRPIIPTEIAKILGEEIDDKESYLYWAAKNDIPVFCPGIIDGSFGDLTHFFMYQHPDFAIDVARDHKRICEYAQNQKKTGAIILGGGIAKHYTMNANIFREGFEYAIYITTAQEFDGSDSGGNEEEAKTWAKIKCDAPHVKIKCEASIAFPLLVAGSFYKKFKEKD